ncbi:hypothetical protein CPB86DRAFT_84374 [Serendipita vermifera]|nr:hypothetical protein CPB86DRAFT_84374 [Serendipita vermifera]
MPRSDSLGSSGASLTSEEDVSPPTNNLPPVTRVKSKPSEMASTTVAGGTTRSAATEKFRQSVFKVMQLNRVNRTMLGHGSGAEPGVDPRNPASHAAYGSIKEHSEIEIIDYSVTNYEIQQFSNAEFVAYMQKTKGKRPAWAKVRWINIAGVSWDVISRLGIAYDLHPLTLENILNGSRTGRSKADYYTNHLFIHIMCQTLKKNLSQASPLDNLVAERSTSPRPILGAGHRKPVHDVEKGANGDSAEAKKSAPPRSATQEQRDAVEDTIRAKEGMNQVLRGVEEEVVTKSLWMYLMRDGTVISVHQADRGFGDPIYNRIRTPNTVLRASSDPSMLIEALLDLVIDRALDIVDRYHDIMLDLERSLLLNPKAKDLHKLHFLSRTLTARRRELDPVKTLIYGLRRYDQERCAAVAESSGNLVPGEKTPGFLSHKAKIYLADVHEHCEWIMTSFEMFEGICENLISYQFNVISYETNNTMRTLTLATIIFLPLTLLTGYFGMNFEPFPAVNNHSDVLFWEIGAPVFVVVTVLFMWRDFVRAWHYLRKKAFIANQNNSR